MQFRVGEFLYDVIAVEAVNSPDEPAAYGYCDQVNRRIELRIDQSVDCAYETLAHEYGHASEAAGIDLARKDDEKRMNAFALIACSFARQYTQQGGDTALRKLLGIPSPAEEIERQTPDIDWANLEGQARFSMVMRYVYCRSLSDSEFATYAAEVEATQLNPFLGECYPLRTADGTIKIAAKMPGIRRLCREYGAQVGDFQWCGKDAVWKDIWIIEEWGYPTYARCPISRDGVTRHGMAKWSAFAQTVTINERRQVVGFWDRMGEHVLALCAERQAAAFVIPQMSNVVIVEEMQYRPKRRVTATIIPQRQLEGGEVAGDEPEMPAAPEPELEPLPVVMSMDELVGAMSEMGVTSNAQRVKMIDRVRASSPKLEATDSTAFFTAVLRAAQASLRA